MQGMPTRGRKPPLALGIYTRLTFWHLYLFGSTSNCGIAANLASGVFQVTLSTPGVFLPLLVVMVSTARA
jgi:hypothetical protein